MSEAVGHADGDLDLVVERFQTRVGVAGSDGSEDVVPASADLPAQFDDLGEARKIHRFNSASACPTGWRGSVLRSSFNCHDR